MALALARCRMAAGRLDEAAAVLDRLRATDPADADVLYETARLQMRAWNETIRQLYEKNPSVVPRQPALRRDPRNPGPVRRSRRGVPQGHRQEPARIEPALPVGARFDEQLARSRDARPRAKEIEAELALNPSDAVATYQAARILQVREHAAEADARYEQALKLRPDFVEALCALGTLRNEERRSAEAIPLLEKAVQLAPASEAGHYALMIAYRNSGRMDDARREKARLDELHKTPEGEFSDFLKKLGEKPPAGK